MDLVQNLHTKSASSKADSGFKVGDYVTVINTGEFPFGGHVKLKIVNIEVENKTVHLEWRYTPNQFYRTGLNNIRKLNP